MKERALGVTALDDPVVQSTLWPFPNYGPQDSLMGYNPYSVMITQQFPWFGTLTLRGQAAGDEAEVAAMELLAAKLEAVAAVKRAYYELYYNERAEAIIEESRRLALDFVQSARTRYATGSTSEEDVLRAEVAVSDLDRELATVRQGFAEAQARLAEQLHLGPETDLRTLPSLPVPEVPNEVDRLYRLAVAARPELKGRLATVARDEQEVQLARKKYYPDITLGLSYMLMTKEESASKEAGGGDNYGFVVNFTLPIYRSKLDAGLREAEARTVADVKRYAATRDQTHREIKELVAQARSRKEILGLFRSSILPKSQAALEAAGSDYQNGNVDYLTLITSWREVLQIKLQMARAEAELGESLAQLERVVGGSLDENPPDDSAPHRGCYNVTGKSIHLCRPPHNLEGPEELSATKPGAIDSE